MLSEENLSFLLAGKFECWQFVTLFVFVFVSFSMAGEAGVSRNACIQLGTEDVAVSDDSCDEVCIFFSSVTREAAVVPWENRRAFVGSALDNAMVPVKFDRWRRYFPFSSDALNVPIVCLPWDDMSMCMPSYFRRLVASSHC